MYNLGFGYFVYVEVQVKSGVQYIELLFYLFEVFYWFGMDLNIFFVMYEIYDGYFFLLVKFQYCLYIVKWYSFSVVSRCEMKGLSLI